MSQELSLYIHIPFCESKCDYCDFYSLDNSSRSDAATQHKYFMDALIKDIYEQIERFKVNNIPTAYIGGGTPSVLGTEIKIILDALKTIPAFKPQEFTIEANPESLTEEFLAACKEGGVTRLSLGVQTFFEPSRLSVNRKGGCITLSKSLALAKEYYPYSLSADLITGFPYHTKKTVIEDIKRLLDYDPAHISLYSLTLEEGTKLHKNIINKNISLSDKDESDELWLAARDDLINAGFKHYEVSNFSKDGKECLHNIRYWRMLGWLGAGPSASGTIIDEENITAERYTYASNIEKYTHGLHELTRINISKEDLLREIIMMGYRYFEGPDPKWEAEKLIPDTIEKWRDINKMLFLNSFLIDAYKEMENKIIKNPCSTGGTQSAGKLINRS